MISIYVTNKEDFINETGKWEAESMDACFLWKENPETGESCCAEILIFEGIKDAKDLANALVHKAIHAHDYVKARGHFGAWENWRRT